MKSWLAERAPALRSLLHLVDGRAQAAVRQEIRTVARSVEERDIRDAVCFGGAIRAIEDQSREPALAWMGPAPYEESGIGRFSWESVRAAPWPTDYFSAATRPGLLLAYDAALAAGSHHRLLDLEAIAYAASARCYRAVVVSVGNSKHNLPALRGADDLETGPARPPLWWHLHDIELLNLAWLLCGEDPRALAARLRASYGSAAISADSVEPSDFPALRARGVLGARAVLRGRRIDRVIVNSRFAARLVAEELRGLAPPDRIITAFHPVFPAERAHSPPKHALRVGSFGMPSASKQTEMVIEACAALRQDGSDVTLVLAGYGVGRYAADRREPLPSWVEAFDSPSRSQLEALMAGASVAVQLRRDALGESSGVVADLASIGVPTIVSDVGAFSELPTAALKLAGDATPEELARAIAEIADAPLSTAVAQDLSPAAFWELIERNLPPPVLPGPMREVQLVTAAAPR